MSRSYAPTKILVQAEDTGNIVSTGFYQPMYSVDSASRIVSNAGLRNTIDLDHLTESTLKSQISASKISSRKSVSAERIFDVSVIEDDNKELLGVLEIKDALAKENIWVTLPVFLAGNVDKVYTHKNMLYEFLNRHFQSRANNFYPIFVQSDIKLATPRDKQTPIKIYPGLIIGTDANSKKGYRVALYETDIGQENICDLHDCPAADIVQFEVAKILAPCFTQDLKNCSNDSAQLRSSHAPDLTQDLNYCSNDSFESGTTLQKSQDTLYALLNSKKPLTKRQKTFLNDPTIPHSYKHAQTLPDAKIWNDSINKEIHGLYDQKKSFVPLSQKDLSEYSSKILQSSFVFKRKLDKDGNVKSYKSRLVIGGNRQMIGDGTFDETFAPTASLTSQRLCFTLATNLGLKPKQLDVEQAFQC